LPSACHISRARYASLGSGCSTERWLNPWRQFQSPGRSCRGLFFCLLPAESWLLRPWFCLVGFSYFLDPAKATPGWHVARMMRAASSLTESSCMCHFWPKACKLESGGSLLAMRAQSIDVPCRPQRERGLRRFLACRAANKYDGAYSRKGREA